MSTDSIPASAPARVLCLSGHDPGGGAGIHADIEAVAAQGAHALTVITALTVQDTRNVRRVAPVPVTLMVEQIEALLADGAIAALKIGLLGAVDQIAPLASLAARLRVPVVLDPVLRAGGGAELAESGLQQALLDVLLPRVSLLTPNAAEARRLAPQAATLEQAARALLASGCGGVLITGGDEPDGAVINTLHRPDSAPRSWTWPRLPETFHGAGCTLAAAVAARLACGDAPEQAVEIAQAWTQRALARARTVGRGRRIPGRSGP